MGAGGLVEVQRGGGGPQVGGGRESDGGQDGHRAYMKLPERGNVFNLHLLKLETKRKSRRHLIEMGRSNSPLCVFLSGLIAGCKVSEEQLDSSRSLLPFPRKLPTQLEGLEKLISGLS